MKSETKVLIVKGACYTIAGFCAPISTALAQWANEGRWPPGVNLLVIGSICFSSAATALLAFLSSSYSTWNAERKTNGNGVTAKPII